VTTGQLRFIDVNDFDFDCDLFDSLLASRKGFLDFVKTQWDRVLYAASVFQVQPLDPDLRPFIAFAQPAAVGKAREQHAQLLQDLKIICGRERITIGAFATDPDSGYDPVHETQARWNLELFKKNESEIPSKQHYRAIFGLLHLLKRTRYRALKNPPMVVGLDPDSPELSLGNLVCLLGDGLPAVIFGDASITKMHDSLSMVLFGFEILVKLYEARELAWVAYFLPWVLSNDGMSQKQVDTYDRVRWFQMTYIYLTKIRVTYESCGRARDKAVWEEGSRTEGAPAHVRL
jgi:hypothetical protein